MTTIFFNIGLIFIVLVIGYFILRENRSLPKPPKIHEDDGDGGDDDELDDVVYDIAPYSCRTFRALRRCCPEHHPEKVWVVLDHDGDFVGTQESRDEAIDEIAERLLLELRIRALPEEFALRQLEREENNEERSYPAAPAPEDN